MSDRVTTRIEGNIATVTLNRAKKRNAVDMDMFAALIETAELLATDRSVRVIVLHGDGDHFCAGIDISVFEESGIGEKFVERLQPRTETGANFFQCAATLWKELPVPVIAALQGMVFGAGFQIAMGADIRYAARDVQMSIMEIKWGIIPDMGITTTLPGVVAQDKVRLLAYTGRILSAREASEFGVITELADDPLAAAQALAHEIATQSPDAIRAIKALINDSWKDDPATALRREASLQSAVLAGDNQAEAVRANMEKRPPIFKDPA